MLPFCSFLFKPVLRFTGGDYAIVMIETENKLNQAIREIELTSEALSHNISYCFVMVHRELESWLVRISNS